MVASYRLPGSRSEPRDTSMIHTMETLNLKLLNIMKTLNILPVLLAALILALVSSASANDGKYEAAMKKNIQAVYQAKTVDEYQQAVNSFDRIALAEKTKWEPHYYSAFGCIMMATQEKDGAKKDAYLDQAVAAID